MDENKLLQFTRNTLNKHILRKIWKILSGSLAFCLCVFRNLSFTGLLCNYNMNLCSTQRSNLRHSVEVFKGTSFLISPKPEDYPQFSRKTPVASTKKKQKQGNNQRQKLCYKKPKQNLPQSQKLRILQGVPLLWINGGGINPINGLING